VITVDPGLETSSCIRIVAAVGGPLIPAIKGRRTSVGTWLDAQVSLLLDADERGDPIAATILEGNGAAAAPLTPDLAREVIARDHGYASWEVAGAHRDEPVDLTFEAAADAVQWGDVEGLRTLLDRVPELVTTRSPFPHHAMLLHHVAANGIEVERQLHSPPNATDVARLLLERGSEPDASCETYGGGGSQTTMYLLVSSAHPAAAGVQAALVEELVRGGSLVDGVDDDGLPMLTAVTFGYTASVEALARCGARVDNIVFAAALGEPAAVRDHLRYPTLATGALLWARSIDSGHLLEHALIAAALHGRLPVVELLLEEGPDLWFTEPTFGSTARGAARYAHHDDIAALLDSLM
jgi:hypothetical protein